ncbi:MAG: DUF4956 domain-containing protein [Bacteroidota bacterium]|nr:DUF4956 domain-containing protein [Bacteroidota bacterium]
MLLLQITEEAVLKTDLDALYKMLHKFAWRYLINFISVLVLIRGVYYSKYKRSDLFFTYFIFNLIIFLICFLLNKVELSMGAAFGLFAVFSMLRYRTEDISLKDMSYLFLVIAMGLVAAVVKIKDASDTYEYLFLGLINSLILLLAFLLEGSLLMKAEAAKIIHYENIDLVHQSKEAELIADITLRTGIKVHRVQIQKIDFLKDEALMKVFYYE